VALRADLGVRQPGMCAVADVLVAKIAIEGFAFDVDQVIITASTRVSATTRIARGIRARSGDRPASPIQRNDAGASDRRPLQASRRPCTLVSFLGLSAGSCLG
jgi:hypothetical protein